VEKILDTFQVNFLVYVNDFLKQNEARIFVATEVLGCCPSFGL